MNTDAISQIEDLNGFIQDECTKVRATEDKPLVIGNVDFWIDDEDCLYHAPSTSKWDQFAVACGVSRLALIACGFHAC